MKKDTLSSETVECGFSKSLAGEQGWPPTYHRVVKVEWDEGVKEEMAIINKELEGKYASLEKNISK